MRNVADVGLSTPGTVLIPAGAPIGEAAAWIGHACWAELRFHEVLSGWLAVETDGELSQTLWVVRAHRAELAESWHHRLPELREFPRPSFVVSSGDVAEEAFAAAEALVDEAASADRSARAATILSGLGTAYRAHIEAAVGPADGPAAASLARAIEVTDADLAGLDAPPSGALPVLL